MNTRRSFLKSLAMVPAALAGAVVVAKAAPKPVWNIDYTDWTADYTCTVFNKTYWLQEQRWSSCYSEEYLEALKNC